MKYKQEHRKSAKRFITALAIAFLLAVCLLQSGCETIAGFGKDITWCAESAEHALQQK